MGRSRKGATSHAVERADSGDGAIPGEVDIDGSGIERLMSKECLDGEEVGAVFVEVGAEGMSQGVAGQAVRPAEAFLMGKESLVYGIGDDMLVRVSLFREKPSHRLSISFPVIGEDKEGVGGKDGKAVGPVLPMGDVDAHVRAGDIVIAEGTDLADAETGGVHEGKKRLMLEVRAGMDKKGNLLLGRDKGEEFIKPAHRELGRVPGLMQDVDGKKAELRNGAVDGAVGKGAGTLKPADVITEFVPGNILRGFMEDGIEVIEIRADVGAVTHKSMVGKTAEGDHLPESI